MTNHLTRTPRKDAITCIQRMARDFDRTAEEYRNGGDHRAADYVAETAAEVAMAAGLLDLHTESTTEGEPE